MNRNKTIDYIEFHANDLPAIKQFYSCGLWLGIRGLWP